MLKTRPLTVRPLEVYRAMFQMQLHDTVEGVRKLLREWTAVHIVLCETGTTRRSVTREQIRESILKELGADGAVLEEGVAIENPQAPTGTIVTIMPDAIRPRIATEYSGWTYLPYPELRRRLKALAEAAWGGRAAGSSSLAYVFMNAPHAEAVLDGTASTTATPAFRRVLDGIVDPAGTVTFCDSHFGFEAPASEFLNQADRILQLVGGREDRLYFDAKAGWFLVFDEGGKLRVARVS